MKALLIAYAAALFLPLNAASPTANRAPNFTFAGVGGVKSLQTLRGQSVVLLLAKSPETRAFRKQLKAIQPLFSEFASRGVVFVAAFSESAGEIQSDIPFVIAANGPAVATAYGLTGDFSIAIIGRDGNLDYLTTKVLAGFRIREVITNSFDVQNAVRKETPKGPPQ